MTSNEANGEKNEQSRCGARLHWKRRSFKPVAHGPHQTDKLVCLSPAIIFHVRQRLETKSFHIKSKICQRWVCFHMASLAGILASGGRVPSLPPLPILTRSARCHLPAPRTAWRGLCWKRRLRKERSLCDSPPQSSRLSIQVALAQLPRLLVLRVAI